MNTNIYTLKVNTREILGKKVKSLRRQDIIPAVIYSSPKDVQNISVLQTDLLKVMNNAGTTSLIKLNMVETGKDETVLIDDVQYNQRTLKPMHVSFHKVNLNEEIETTVPFEIIGEAPAIKGFGGILVTVIDEIEVKCLPTNIPHSITLDVSGLENIGDGISLKDISIPKDVKLVRNDEESLSEIIVTISAPQKEEEVAVVSEETVAPEEIELSVERGKGQEEASEETTPKKS